MARLAKAAALALAVISLAKPAHAQDTPLISGGAGFFSNTPGGQTSYLPEIQPVLAAPIGKKFLIESRALLSEDFFPNPSVHGYDHAEFIALQYLQLDYLASRHLTVVAGSFLTPFNVFNERLSQIWVNPFQDGPLIESIADFSSGTSLGAQLRGSALSRRKYSLDYAAYFSARSSNQQFNAGRAAGGRLSLYLPEKRLEVGASYTRQLQGVHENFYGAHAWWEPKDTAFRLRSEYARGHHAQGYWVGVDYRSQAFGGLDSWVGRIEPIFRFQQTFRRDNAASDTLPATNTQRADFGLNYNLPHNTRILTSYSRVFSAAGNSNLWETGIVYRFLFPTWKGK
ncbi:hypothetical protein [Acidipila sp. EB88]|uniref:hypothetical protein n=1 Tax=Acidipila sp. EB88 TaxID=2305226 RepID=UPI000F6011E3|nr:hypothetical protein [Acidipila sp. EB88]RRA50275.1 hypothetical protein D1Y84_16480 [Acidipila sp. EB88]